MATKNITVPDIGGASDVEVIEVLIKIGDHIKVDTPLITLESDKATMEVPSSDEGIVKELKVKVGSKVSLGSTILVLETDKAGAEKEPVKTATEKESINASSPSTSKQTADSSSTSKKEEPVPAAVQEQNKSAAPAEKNVEILRENESVTTLGSAEIHAGPAVRKLAREFGVNLQAVSATGPKQRILKEDVQGYVKTRLAQPPAVSTTGLPQAPSVDFTKFGPIETQALSRIKKISGKNLHRNWLLVPHVTQFGEADITEMENFRVARNAMLDKKGIKLTPLVFILKAIAGALKQFPQFNSSLDPNGENLILKKYVHVGVAVDTPDGLVVPVIRDVDKKGVTDLAKELAEVSEKARNKQLTSNDMQGGTFSISSLGGIGGTAFTPIVNVPEVAILGVSKSSYKPIYQDGHFIPRLMLPLSMSYDHRVIDGADGARFMVYLTNTLADIRNLLL
jgi:pyruvate dehydrogenase E2 component (dihydrolipoamide acetyltransferase)